MEQPYSYVLYKYLLKLSSRNENTYVLRADNSVKNLQNLPVCNHKSDLHNINARIMFGENPLIFTKLSSVNENIVAGR